jgi:hypothetical protein
MRQLNRRLGGHKYRPGCRTNCKEKIPTPAGNSIPLIKVVSTHMKDITFSKETESSLCQLISRITCSTS